MKLSNRMNLSATMIISILTAALAIIGAIYSQVKENEKDKQLADEKVKNTQAQADLKDKVVLTQAQLNEYAGDIIKLQNESRIQVKEKTDEIISLQAKLNDKNIAIIKSQEEQLKYFTGGEKIVEIVPSPSLSLTSDNSVSIFLFNNSNYPQYGVFVHLIDGVKREEIFRWKDLSGGDNKAMRMSKEGVLDLKVDLEPHQKILIFKTNIPQDYKTVDFDVYARNGRIFKTIKYMRGKFGIWELLDKQDFEHLDTPFFFIVSFPKIGFTQIKCKTNLQKSIEKI